jgi:hypothetical protein
MRKAPMGIAVVLAALLAAITVAACGSSNSNSADQDQITKAIQVSATSGDPSACTQYETQRFVEQTNSGTGQAAVKSCEKDANQSVADKVDVSDISVNGDTATAKAAVTGSIFNGQTLNVGLVKESGQWKLDQFKGFENFDRNAMIAGFQKELASQPGSTPQAVSCVVQQFQKATDQQIESTFTSSNSQAENQLFAPCGKYFKQG